MSENTKREWYFYIKDMIDFATKAQTYTEGMTQAEFEASRLTYDATLRNLELIGEAARHIPEDIKTQYSDVPWRMMIATRNRLIHAYIGIDNDIIWSILQDDIPSLLEQLSLINNGEQ